MTADTGKPRSDDPEPQRRTKVGFSERRVNRLPRARDTNGDLVVDVENLMGLPMRPFMYTTDQLAVLLSVSESNIKSRYIYFEGRSTGSKSIHLMLARNIAKPEDKPEWRVSEREFIRWLTVKGFRIYDVGIVTS